MPKAHQQWKVLPHGRLHEIDPNILTVTGTISMPLLKLPRRMTVARLTGKRLVIFSAIALAASATAAQAQVGKGLVDPNVASEKEIASLPHMTPAIAKALIDRRPFMSVTDLNTLLLAQKLTPAQATEFYRKAFVHINLNTGTRDEFLLVPGAGTRMARQQASAKWAKSWHTPRRCRNTSWIGVDTSVAVESNVNSS